MTNKFKSKLKIRKVWVGLIHTQSSVERHLLGDHYHTFEDGFSSRFLQGLSWSYLSLDVLLHGVQSLDIIQVPGILQFLHVLLHALQSLQNLQRSLLCEELGEILDFLVRQNIVIPCLPVALVFFGDVVVELYDLVSVNSRIFWFYFTQPIIVQYTVVCTEELES